MDVVSELSEHLVLILKVLFQFFRTSIEVNIVIGLDQSL